MSFLPARHTFTVWKEATFRKRLTLNSNNEGSVTPWDLTEYSGSFSVYHETTDSIPLTELTTKNGGVILGGEEGTIEIFMSAADTTTLPWVYGVYELLIAELGGDTYALLWGSIRAKGV